MVLTIKVNLAKPLPLYFSGFFLIFFKLILLKINANGKPRPAVNGERTKEIKLITLRGSWVFFWLVCLETILVLLFLGCSNSALALSQTSLGLLVVIVGEMLLLDGLTELF